MTSIYSLAVLTSAFLLFLVQPMAAKLLLPYLGGSPAVWNTAMVFFQISLLLGYCYAHATAKWLGARRQALLHIALVLFSLLLLPIAMRTDLGFSGIEQPIRWVMTSLALSVGIPFILLAANAPMLQYWFAHTSHRDAQNPYFLYAASNIGSMVALLGYPFLLEPHFGLSLQFYYWSVLFAVFALLLASCGIILYKMPVLPESVAQSVEAEPAPAWLRRAHWVLLAFVPSSLLLGVTTYITTDIASMPLFWVIPLAIYLLTFVLAFAKTPLMVDRAQNAQISLVTITALLIAFDITFLTQFMILHLFAFFAVAMGCHGYLVKLRPQAKHLTEFYLWISLGGMLGGMFNSLLAPLIFKLPFEYPLVLFLAMFLRPRSSQSTFSARAELLLPLIFTVLVFALLHGVGVLYGSHAGWVEGVGHWLGDVLPRQMMGKSVSLMQLLAIGFFLLSMGMAWYLRERPFGFAVMIGAILVAVPMTGSGLSSAFFKNTIYTERNFFGVNRVIHMPEKKVHYLVHGTTLHGTQSLEPEHRLDLVSYYPPLRAAYEHLKPAIGDKPIAVVGLGGGTLACLAGAGQEEDLFEIDPAVLAIASNPEFFTFMRDCPGKFRNFLGDGRLELAKQPEGRYGLIVLDAFSSDAVPLHLMTREAVKLYMSKLAKGGVLVFNISNNHLDLTPVVAAIAEANGLVAISKRAFKMTGPFDMPAIWAMVARSEADFYRLGEAIEGWHVLIPKEGIEPWTDDYSNIFQVLM